MTNRKALSMVGLAMRAGKLSCGEMLTDKALKSGKAYLLLTDEKASDRTINEFSTACDSKGIPMRFLSEGELAEAIGKPDRIIAAVTDMNFARQIIKLIDGGVLI